MNRLRAYLPPHLAGQFTARMTLDEATAILIHLTSLRYTLAAYLPRYLLKSITERPEPGRVEGRFHHGTLLLADVAGFTALSEKLAARGREGAEEMAHILNQIFDPILDISSQYGGDVLKFGGDSLLIFFEGDDAPRRAATWFRSTPTLSRGAPSPPRYSAASAALAASMVASISV
ncbi:MAG: adenylate/guanylate cyclase domain-containing protein [Anaerolineae bacterium]